MTIPDQQRREIAVMAARFIADEGLISFREARHRAATALHASQRDLPDDQEILAALREHLELFEPDHAAAVEDLRLAALQVMDVLAPFKPQVTGCAAEGLAPEGALIELLLWADSEKDVEMTLMKANIRYEVSPTRDPRSVIIHCHDSEPAVDLRILAPGHSLAGVMPMGRNQPGIRLSREALAALVEGADA